MVMAADLAMVVDLVMAADLAMVVDLVMAVEKGLNKIRYLDAETK
jgi:hypothetical protein